MEAPKSPQKLHMVQIFFATLASIVSIVGGAYSLKSNIFQPRTVFGELAGRVQDERLAKPLRLVTVEVYDDAEQLINTVTTDDDGWYRVEKLGEGEYRIKASAPFHEPKSQRVTIQKDHTSTIDFALTPVAIPPPEIPPIPQIPQAPRLQALSETPVNYATYPLQPQPTLPREPALPESVERQPTSTELLVETGAVLIGELLEKKRRRKAEAERLSPAD